MEFAHIQILSTLLYCTSLLCWLLKRFRVVVVLIVCGLIANVLALAMRGFIDSHFYLALVAEDEIYVLPAVLAGIALYHVTRRAKLDGVFVLAPLVLTSLFVILSPSEPGLPSAKINIWVAPTFFLIETLSAGLIFASAGLSLGALLLHKGHKNTLTDRYILVAFVLFSISQILGALWAYSGWSYPFSWSNRHLASASVWCLYAALIHSHLVGMRPKTAAIIASLGALPMLLVIYHHQLAPLLLAAIGHPS
ncbi:MAG: cytochrome c biogenesis protein CcsA [Deltaproteobacteria bacterium]|nr:cytochrome c biogenesis protein CcsA [Deltaproteobacteria bacterium]